MSSKRDFLLRYYSDGGGEGESKRKSKKKKKRDRRSKSPERGRDDSKVVLKDDESRDFMAIKNEADENDEEGNIADGIDEEDAPIVVEVSSFPPVVGGTPPKNSATTGKRRRYDSDSEDDHGKNELVASTGDSLGHPYRVNSNSNHAQHQQLRQRHDSDEDENHGRVGVSSNPDVRRKRYDSSTDDESSCSRQHKTQSDKDNSASRTSSGRQAGLQSGRDFAKSEREIQKEQRALTSTTVDQHGMGETIHRKGSSDTTSKSKKWRPVLDKEQQRILNTGTVQQKQLELAKLEFSKVQQSTFARGKDDSEIEDAQRNAIREGDPMAAFSAKTSRKVGKAGHINQKPVYCGPSAKPNRFGIRPGFRWDGNDRGNGFEDRLLAKQASLTQQREDAYRWNASGM